MGSFEKLRLTQRHASRRGWYEGVRNVQHAPVLCAYLHVHPGSGYHGLARRRLDILSDLVLVLVLVLVLNLVLMLEWLDFLSSKSSVRVFGLDSSTVDLEAGEQMGERMRRRLRARL